MDLIKMNKQQDRIETVILQQKIFARVMSKKYLTGGDILGMSLQSGAGAILSPFNALTGGALDPLQQNINKEIGNITNQDPKLLKTANEVNQAQNQISGLGLDLLSSTFKNGGSITEMFTQAYSHGGKLDYNLLESIGVTKRQANKAYKNFVAKYEEGGSLMPYNPEHLDNVSENLVQYDGPDHPQGGIKTPAPVHYANRLVSFIKQNSKQ